MRRLACLPACADTWRLHMLSGMWMCKWMGKWMCLWLRRGLSLCRRVWGRDWPGGGKFWFGVDVDDDALIYYARLRAATNNQVSNSSRNANENTQNDFLCPDHKGTREGPRQRQWEWDLLRLLRERQKERDQGSLPCLLRCLPKLPAKWGNERYREIPGEVAKARKFGRLEKQSQLISWLPSCPAQVKLLPAPNCPSFTPLCVVWVYGACYKWTNAQSVDNLTRPHGNNKAPFSHPHLSSSHPHLASSSSCSFSFAILLLPTPLKPKQSCLSELLALSSKSSRRA